jgi:TRAP-type transport system large permease protein
LKQKVSKRSNNNCAKHESPSMTVFVFVFSLLAAMALGMPIAYALLVCGASLMGFLALNGTIASFDSQILAQRFVDGADNFPLLAVPFFLLAGEFMNAGGLSKRIVNMGVAWVGHFRGGLGYVAVFAAIIMASLSGSAVADTAALAAILIPMMRAAGYDVGRSAGLVAAGSLRRSFRLPSASSFLVWRAMYRSPSCFWPASCRGS